MYVVSIFDGTIYRIFLKDLSWLRKMNTLTELWFIIINHFFQRINCFMLVIEACRQQ
jgi:hypothetical protein